MLGGCERHAGHIHVAPEPLHACSLWSSWSSFTGILVDAHDRPVGNVRRVVLPLRFPSQATFLPGLRAALSLPCSPHSCRRHV